nr:MAG TPA: hypothetical protein [Caudoviricetes sp.]
MLTHLRVLAYLFGYSRQFVFCKAAATYTTHRKGYDNA